MSKKILTPLNLLTMASDPSSGTEGDIYFNTDDKSIRIFNGITWVTIVKSDDPVPFYEHTHTYDGDVHTINIQDPILLGGNVDGNSVLENIPVIIGEDGGSPNSIFTRQSQSNLSNLDGGIIGQ
ncbi:hypothetical protein UFOVP204_172 [uncultured Caudovirales phage]|uniref:Uncharacterized protein n=1 Tax=uncultured Caudovirales phage TaxID=2100421 RepID=A0A6J7WKG4_9CAUD|nr:hypothetical protein UFOVP204_172 [uncultured Caudovirales phage]